MRTRDGKVTILDKWEGGFGQVNPYEVRLPQSMYAAGFTAEWKFGAGFILECRFWGAGSRSWGGGPPPLSDPPSSPVTSGYRYTPGGDYCAPGCQPLSSPIQPYPQQVKGTTSSFERPQRRAKLSRMLAGSSSLGITLCHHFRRGP